MVKKKQTRKIKVRIFFSSLAKDKTAAGNMRLGSERLTMGFVFLRFGTSTIEPHLSSAAQNLRRLLLLTDKNISSLRNLLAETERKQFASQNPAVVSQTDASRSSALPLAQVGIQTMWEVFDEEERSQPSRLLVAAFKRLFRGHQRDVRRCAARQPPVKLATFGFVQLQQLSWRESTIDVPKYTNLVEVLALFLLFFVCFFFLVHCQRLRTQAPKFCRLIELPSFQLDYFCAAPVVTLNV